MIIKMFLLINLLLLSLSINADSLNQNNKQLNQAIQEQINSATDCEIMAYGVELKYSDADEVFKSCIERRAILIGMQKRYGPGQYGEIDIFDKIEGYSHLADSNNELVRKEANRHITAAGDE